MISIFKIYERIGKNMFFSGKNVILNTLGILCLLQNFGIRKDPEYLYQLLHVLYKQTTCEMIALQVQVVYIHQLKFFLKI